MPIGYFLSPTHFLWSHRVASQLCASIVHFMSDMPRTSGLSTNQIVYCGLAMVTHFLFSYYAQQRDRKARFKKAYFTFGRGLRPTAREQNSLTERRSLGKCQGYRKEA